MSSIIEGLHTFPFNQKKFVLLGELKKCYPEAAISVNRGSEDLELIIISDRFTSLSSEERLIEVNNAIKFYDDVIGVIKVLTRKEILGKELGNE